VDKLFPSFLAIDSKSRHIVILNQRKSSCKKYTIDLNFNRLLTVLFFQMASFIKGLIDKVEGGGSGKQYQNEQHSSSQGFNPQQQHGGPGTQQGKTDFGACQQEQHYDEVYFLGHPPASYQYQEGHGQQGYGQQGYNHQGGPPPSYGNQGQHGMMNRQEGEEHRRGGSPRQFEGREQDYQHNRGRQQEHERERNRSPDEYKYQQRPEGHGRDREQNREHERRRSRSRD
jgi:hypothetical protein